MLILASGSGVYSVSYLVISQGFMSIQGICGILAVSGFVARETAFFVAGAVQAAGEAPRLIGLQSGSVYKIRVSSPAL